MRIFKTFHEAEGEIKRDLKEMGISVKGTHMQDKVGNFHTLELINYGYTVLHPNINHLPIPNMKWLNQEWNDRKQGIEGLIDNPGAAFHNRKDDHIDWSYMLEYNGEPIPTGKTIDEMQKLDSQAQFDPIRFAYTYQERLACNEQVWHVIRELRRNPESRQLFIAMWDPHKDAHRLGKHRVPCSLGWHIMMREDHLNVTYFMRSCDFVTHWANDAALSMLLLTFVAEKANMAPGELSHFINSFHVYKKDVKDIF
jgi:thymidylate synthase